jgi:hypothetical protein
MSCAKVSLQRFVDWMTAPQQGFFVHVVTVLLVEKGGGQTLDQHFIGQLAYVPVRIIGPPPTPGHPGLRFSNFFQGNMVDTGNAGNVRHMLIELFDPIEIILETISGHRVTGTVTLTNISCSPSEAGVTIQSQGNDGEFYQIILNTTSFFHTPHQVGFRH